MKRLNPDTGKPFVRGDTRADGFLFWQYRTMLSASGFNYEEWKSPNSFTCFVNKTATYRKIHYEKNKQHVKSVGVQYRKSQSHKLNAKNALRKSAKLQRTPNWLTKEHLQQIESVYALAQRLSIETGISYHVDHIVPLQGKNVSGLHVPWNLRAIPASDNCSKSNRF